MGSTAVQEQVDAGTHYRAGEARHRAGDLAGALAFYDAALEQEPDHIEALRLSAMALHQQGAGAEALRRIEAAMNLTVEEAPLWSARGVILAALDQPARAAESYRRALTLDGGDGVSWFNLGLILRALGESDAEIDAFAEASTCLDVAVAHHELGVSLQGAGRLDAACHSYQCALDLGAGADSALNAGAARQLLGDAARAEAFYRQALALDPGCARALSNLAALAEDAGDHDEAAELCRHAIALDPALTDAHVNLGVSLLRAGASGSAQTAFAAALDIDPFDVRALANLTELLFDDGRFEEALAHGRRLTDARPADSRCWLTHADLLDRADDLAGAAEALQRAAELDPTLWKAPHRLGEVLQRQGETAAALEHHRRACALAPQTPDAWRQLALAAVKAGDGDTALAGLDRLLQLDPYDPEAWAYRALALRQIGRAEEADDLASREGLVAVIPLAPPAGHASLEVFHRALKADLAATLRRVWSPRGQSVVNGYQTQNDLFAEPAPTIRALATSIDATVAAFLEDRGEAVRRFVPTPPALRRYRSWSVALKAGGHHAPHIHPEGCLSGVYYVEAPDDPADLGGLEFGRPGIAAPLPSAPPTHIVQPKPGNLVLFPSYLWHGTLPFQAGGDRITVAFDLMRSGPLRVR